MEKASITGVKQMRPRPAFDMCVTGLTDGKMSTDPPPPNDLSECQPLLFLRAFEAEQRVVDDPIGRGQQVHADIHRLFDCPSTLPSRCTTVTLHNRHAAAVTATIAARRFAAARVHQ